MEFKTTLKKIDEVIPYEDNARINDKAVEKVAQSIKEYGWQSPIVVDENNVILAGHSRLKAAFMLGLNEVPVKIAENLTDKQKMAYRIMDNKSQDFALWNNKLLAAEFEKLAKDGFDLKLTGFELDEIGKLNQSMLQFDTPADVDVSGLNIDASFDVPDTNIKQFQLLFDIRQYEAFAVMLETLKEKYKVDNNTDAVYKAVQIETST